ncbi:MAG TPA: diaminopimelate epimerase, partial [Methanobacterium sp.]|nr:diaminopimelate epimerase [Methanobacterium sp.]
MIINLKFTKMHGLGNDYVVIDESNELIISEDRKPLVSEELCNRRFSIGADGVIFISPSTREDADIKFRIFNADGSEAEMCGNGIRCFSKFVYENGIIHSNRIMVETMVDVKELQLKVDDGEVTSIRVDMGTANFNPEEIPMDTAEKEFIDKEIMVNNKLIKMTAISVGNPHAVAFTEDIESVPLEKIGPLIEYHPAFPQRINAHFVRVLSRDEVEMITWERGTGVTLACGTGATSSVLAGYRLGLLDEQVLVHLPGGELNITVYNKGDLLGA